MTVTAPRIPAVVLLWDRFQPEQRSSLVNLVRRLRENLAFGGDVALRTGRPAGVSVEIFVAQGALTIQARSRITMLAGEVGAIAVHLGGMATSERFRFLGAYGRSHGRANLVEVDPRVAVDQLLGSAAQEQEGGAARRSRVLVADDSAFFRTTLTNAFVDLGCEVMAAKDGAEAMEIVAENVLTLNLLVLDVEMPGMDGADVLDRIRRLGGERDLCVAIVTGRPDRREELLRLGADAVLGKGGPVGALARRLLEVIDVPREQRLAG